MSDPIGYFLWRITSRYGELTCEKILNEHRLGLLSGNSFDNQRYTHRLLAEHALTEEQWKLSLKILAQLFPAPRIPPLERKAAMVKEETEHATK